MAKAFGEIEASAETTTLTHPEWLGLLLDQEVSYRRDRRLLARLRYARLRHQASVEDIDYRAARGLDRALFQKLAACGWIDAHENLILCGPTGGVIPSRPTRQARPCTVPSGCLTPMMKTLAPTFRSLLSPGT